MKVHEPPMTFKVDVASQWTDGLAKNDDPYGNAVYRYASEWATRMEEMMAGGATLTDCAKHASRVADDEGITGFMYGCAVELLTALWIHGEELRRWHNITTQIRNEGEIANEKGGVLNPALLNIEVPE